MPKSYAGRRAVPIILALFIGVPLGNGGVSADQGGDEKKRDALVFFPLLFYSPETKLGGGAAFIRYFRGEDPDTTARPSTVQPALIYTMENQIVSSLETDVYWDGNANRLLSGIGYIKFPDLFYGIGPNTPDALEESYTPETFFFNAGYFRTVKRSVRLGIQYDFSHASVLEREEGGLLDAGDITGSRGGDASGLGISVGWDSRDNIYYSSRGSFYNAAATFFYDGIGSDFDFNRYIVDLRHFWSLGTSSVLALQGFAHISGGSPPFQMMAALGGQDKGRGFYGGRFRDRHSLIAQAEFRHLVLRRWGTVLFAGAGAVSPKLDSFQLDEAKPFGGFGFRYVFNTDERINVRLDFGFAEDSAAFYFTAGESF